MDDKQGVILQLYSRAHAPNRDYYGLTISSQDVILNVWNITHGPHIFPKKQHCPLEDISYCKTLLSEIHRLFGGHVVDFTLALGRKHARLECLPTKLFLKILRYLACNDILKLGQTSKIFFELCNRSIVWEIIFRKRNHGAPSRDEVKAANQKSWKIVLKNKLVWAERLQRTGKDKPTTETKVKVKEPGKRVTSAKKQSESKTSLTTKKIGIKVPDFEKLQLLDNQHETKNKSIFTTKHLDDAISALQASKINKADSKQMNQMVLPSKGTVNSFKVHNIDPQQVQQARQAKGLPIKGILKQSSENVLKRSQLKDIICDQKEPAMTKIDYRPLSKTRFTVTPTNPLISLSSTPFNKGSVTSLLSGILAKDRNFSASDRHLDRFLSDLDKKSTTNPFQLDPKLVEVPIAPSKTRSISAKLSTCNTCSMSAKKNGLVNIHTSSDKRPSIARDEVKMPSKFEDYLKSLHGHSVHPDVGFELRKDAGRTTLSKADLVPKISELGKSINHIRSSFYGTGNEKQKVRLNNSKKTNQEQQLNNKLNTTVASTSALEIKKNAIKTFAKSATAVHAAVRVKDTNCAPPVHKYAKPTTTSATKKPTKK